MHIAVSYLIPQFRYVELQPFLVLFQGGDLTRTYDSVPAKYDMVIARFVQRTHLSERTWSGQRSCTSEIHERHKKRERTLDSYSLI